MLRSRPEKLEPLWMVRAAPEPLSTKMEAYCPACRHPTVDVTTHRAKPSMGSMWSDDAPPGGTCPRLWGSQVLSGHLTSVHPLAGLGSVHAEAGRPRLPPNPSSPSGLTCSCSSPCTDTVKTLPLPSRSEMVSRDLDTVPRLRAQKLGPHPSAQGSPVFEGASPLSVSRTVHT